MANPKTRVDPAEDALLALAGIGIAVVVFGFAAMLVWLFITSLFG